ncbi:uncharacterized protein KNAG_0J00920 [Huiozyma naganishii CBS 8797]|uniref:DNA-binding protein REB1 n=1 Tax=Huiozyma naganishii (strain ATCC MYA-139 / BCRC 22969 / CBS 8797 / KCTC 17520 / NBRC 10181 / NCYC 3082 / Yp74L-3) TaxID=1071383 RepID=J7S9L3_HUIN7|nr:hypothetical protein KNAG_0J00920 [Kazachstania naganishii CBS 8797]CCK72174.1 hypothetical protein KNAG_0J00920 [Kazachstania naganishii CBS 8797]
MDESVEEAVFKYVRQLEVDEELSQDDDGTNIDWYLKLMPTAQRDGATLHRGNDALGGDPNATVDPELKSMDLLSRTSAVGAQSPQIGPAGGTALRLAPFKEILPKVRNFNGPEQQQQQREGEFPAGEVQQLRDEIVADVNRILPRVQGANKFTVEEDRLVSRFAREYCRITKLDGGQFRDLVWKTSQNDTVESTTFWKCMFAILPHRSHSSICKHLRRLFNDFGKTGKWNSEEDKLLNELCTEGGLVGKWVRVGQILKRVPDDCRDRWRNYVSCRGTQQMNEWSPEEEEKLRAVVHNVLETKNDTERDPLRDEALFNNLINWAEISELMGRTRSRIQCRYKWNKLVRRAMVEKLATMDKKTLSWLFSEIQRYNSVNDIEWTQISKETHGAWSAAELKLCFEKRIKKRKRYASAKLSDLCKDVLNETVTAKAHSK